MVKPCRLRLDCHPRTVLFYHPWRGSLKHEATSQRFSRPKTAVTFSPILSRASFSRTTVSSSPALLTLDSTLNTPLPIRRRRQIPQGVSNFGECAQLAGAP